MQTHHTKVRSIIAIAIALSASLTRAADPPTLVQKSEQTSTQKYIAAQLKKFAEADKKEMPPKDAVLFVGSSSIEKWTDLAADFPKIKVINRGIGGAQIVDCTAHADQLVEPYAPKQIVFYAGDNDLAAGKTPQEVADDYQKFVKLVRKSLPKTPIAFISIKPSPSRTSLLENMIAANALIKKFIADDKTQTYIDVFTPMLGDDGEPRGELFVSDRLHMNKDGYALWRKIVTPYVSP
jgi:lysophospholipase L1-like esterase